MDEKQQKGVASELIAEYYLTRAGYFVYTKKSVQSAVDLVAINPITGEILLVDVKTVSLEKLVRKKVTTINRVLSEEQKRLGVNLLYVYEDKTCELIKYENNNIVRKILNKVL
jgi:hypothetical protein